MKFYEYQAKAVYDRFHIPKPEGLFAPSDKDIPSALKKLGRGPWALKAQVMAGGRGKAGGVRVVNNLKDAKKISRQLLAKSLVTHQTGPRGERVAGILVEKSIPKISRELYLSILLDRKTSTPLILASQEGGVDIEVLAKEKPQAILKFPVDPLEGLLPYRARLIAKQLGFSGKTLIKGALLLTQLAKAFMALDANLIEINPLALTVDGQLLALDGKISTDDNALFRHPDQMEWKRALRQPPAEKKAEKSKISYIQLHGNVGCLVNGAGLAMATMDIIKLHGGQPANFLDVGGGASQEQVTDAFKIILSDKRVEGVLVNIFGGIMRCDVIARGIVAAAKRVRLRVPLVIRLEGTKVHEGKEILAKSKLNVTPANSLEEAAHLIIQAIEQSKVRKNGHSRR